MKLYQIIYEIVFVVNANNKEEARENALHKIEGYLDAPDDLRTLLQTAVMDAGPRIKEIKK